MTAQKLTDSHNHNKQPQKDELKGLRSQGYFARWPVIGLTMFIFGTLMFGALTFNLLANGPLIEWDKTLANTLPALALQSPPFMQPIMDAGYYIGNHILVVLGILFGLYFLFKRYWQEFAMVSIGLVGSSMFFLSLSAFFARARPPTQIWLILDIPGYPSGHAITVIPFYGLLAYLLVPKIKSAFWKGVVIAAALFIILFVGFSRVFTGGHYLTDVLSGYAIGIAWSGLAYTLIELYTQKRRSHNVKKE